MNKKHIVTLIFPLLSSVAVAAGSMSVKDENNDGRISKDEWNTSVKDAALFSEWDQNNNGTIEESEYISHDYYYDFGDWDGNNDEVLNENEFYEGWFNAFDDNQNDVWDGSERDDAGEIGLFDV